MIADINNERQNHPELIVRDLQGYISPDLMRETLKRRGINKWLRVRRLLIQLKHRWKEEIKQLDMQKAQAKGEYDMRRYLKLIGYQECLVNCRQQIRALCHSPRDIDFPESPHDFGDACLLPSDFPAKPHKRWFCNHTPVKIFEEVK